MAFVPLLLGVGALSAGAAAYYRFFQSKQRPHVAVDETVTPPETEPNVMFESILLQDLSKRLPAATIPDIIVTDTTVSIIERLLPESLMIPDTLFHQIENFDRSSLRRVGIPQEENNTLIGELKQFKRSNLKKTFPRIVPRPKKSVLDRELDRFRSDFHKGLEYYRLHKKLV